MLIHQTGHAEIDRQHELLRQLILQIDAVESTPANRLDMRTRRLRLSALSDDILKALVGHQTYEGKLMELLPDLPACRAHVVRHRSAHAKLQADLTALVGRIAHDNPRHLAGEIRQVLTEWLPPHHRDFDAPLSKNLARYSATELVLDRALVHLLDDHVFVGRPQPAQKAHGITSFTDDPATAYARLTPRQKEVCALLVAGHSAPSVAEVLGVSVNTIKTHRTEIFRKMGAKKLLDLARLTDALDAAKPD